MYMYDCISHDRRIMVVHREVTQASDGKKDVLGAYLQHVGVKSSSLQVYR